VSDGFLAAATFSIGPGSGCPQGLSSQVEPQSHFRLCCLCHRLLLHCVHPRQSTDGALVKSYRPSGVLAPLELFLDLTGLAFESG